MTDKIMPSIETLLLAVNEFEPLMPNLRRTIRLTGKWADDKHCRSAYRLQMNKRLARGRHRETLAVKGGWDE